MYRTGLLRRSLCLTAACAISASSLVAQSTYLDVLVYGPQENPIAAAAFLLTAQGTTYNDIQVASYVTATAAGLVPALEGPFPPNLLILDLSAGPPDGAWPSAIADYVAGGGCAIATVRTGEDASAIAATFNASFAAEHDALPVYNWVLEPLWQSFDEIPTLLPVIDNVVEPNGVYLSAAAGGTEHAGFTVAPTAGQAAVVVGNQGRTILHGFLPSDLSPSDQDADDDDLIELGKNEVFAVGSTGCVAASSVLEVPALSGAGLAAMAALLALAATAVTVARRRVGARD